MLKVGVVDYDAGNLRSVETALEHLGADFLVSQDPEVLKGCDKLIFPGVGDAGASMEVLGRTGLGPFLKDWARSGRLLLGICVGCQLLFDFSEERNTPTLGILPGRVRLFPRGERDGDGRVYKVPHMGWNQVNRVEGRDHPLFKGIPQGASFYFVHSYYPDPAESHDVLAVSEYVVPFACAVARDNVMATQFHPEKSGEPGLRMLQNYLEL